MRWKRCMPRPNWATLRFPDGNCRLIMEQRLGLILTGGGARCAEKLEERSFAENVEVAGIGMHRVEKGIARFAGAHPAVFEAGQAALIKRNHPCGLLQGCEDARMECVQ